MNEEPVAITCPHCGRVASAWVQGEATWDGVSLSGNHEEPPTSWRLLQCSACRHVVVDWRYDFGRGFEEDEPSLIYPRSRQMSPEIPEGLRDELGEAQICYRNKAYKATAVMVRRTLEGTCKENGVKEKTLVASLQKLLDNGTIEQTLHDWANELRVVGNEGAHYTGNPVSREDAEDALAFAEALVDHVYVLKKRFAEFQARRLERKAAAAQPAHS